MFREEVQKIPLRHQRHKLARPRHMAEIRHIELGVADDHAQRSYLLMRQLQKLPQQPKLPARI